MTNRIATPATGYRATHPGRILRRELEARGMTQAQLAAQMERPAQVISQIVREKKSVTPETALGLEQVLGIAAHVWLNLQTNYDLALARSARKERLAD